MKLKIATRLDWQRILKHRFTMKEVHDSQLSGHASLYAIDDLKEPLITTVNNSHVVLADAGYQWLQLFPKDKHYVITAIFDTQATLIRWYIDIALPYFVNEHGIPCYYDLYLDLDIAADGTIILLDVDELDEALAQGKVSHVQYELAWKETDRLMLAIENDRLPLLWSCETYREELIAQLPPS